MTDLENLDFKIKEKEDELNRLTLTTFIYNPRISELARELTELKEERKKMEDNKEWVNRVKYFH